MDIFSLRVIEDLFYQLQLELILDVLLLLLPVKFFLQNGEKYTE